MSTATLSTLETTAPAPVQLVRGSVPGGGGGCAMNALSVYNQDFKVTDYPGSAAPPLARLVQLVNDEAADPAGVLSEADSDAVLLLAAATHGTGAAESAVLYGWLAELLVNEQWGLTASLDASDRRVRRLCRALAGCLRIRARGGAVSPLRLMRIERLSYNLMGVPSPVQEAVRNARLVVRSEIGWAAVFAAENAAAEARKVSRIDQRQYTQLAISAWRELAGPSLCGPPSLRDLRAAAARLNARSGR
ncbi:hypothetical protein [Mycobacteroides abscessus]|uniref:hypothetical protein n=1 Tax=Mycobacteroides abscessus TaxID=36809 RepID=UPI00104C7014|nr:hypothetical protein [Mycobacteroides abscessus]